MLLEINSFIAPSISVLAAVLTAATALWLNYSAKKAEIKTVNKAILAEISRLLQVLGSHLNWWHSCMKQNNTDLPLITFNIDVYDNFLKNIGNLDDGYSSNAVGFYGFIKFLNVLQKARMDYHMVEKGKTFDKTYESALYNLIKNYRSKFDSSFKHFSVAEPYLEHCKTNVDNQDERLKLLGIVSYLD